MKHTLHPVVLALLFGSATSLPVRAINHNATQPGTIQSAQVSSPLVDAEVRKVDTETKKITLRHGPIPNLEMPAMTMVFQVKDPAMLYKVNAGDKVKFSADKIGGQYTVTRIEGAK